MKKIYTLYKKLLPVVAALILSCTAFNALAQEVTVNICPGDTVSLYAKVPYNGAKPTYLWTVNGAPALKNTDSVFTCTPVDGDEIVCLVTPHPSDICWKSTYTPKYIIKEKCDTIYYKVCSDDHITFVASEEDGIEVSNFQWIVNSVPVLQGKNDSIYTHTPTLNSTDTVYCILTSDEECADPAQTPKYIITLREPLLDLSVVGLDTTVCDTLPVIIAGNTFGGSASKIDTIKVSGGGGTVSWTKMGSPFVITYVPVGADTGKTIMLTVITDSIAPCPPAKKILALRINSKSIINLDAHISEICSEEKLNFTVTAPPSGTIIGWTRKTVLPYISNPAGSGDGSTVSETLINTTQNSVPVEYLFTIDMGGCIRTGKVIIHVNPKVSVKAKIVVKKS